MNALTTRLSGMRQGIALSVAIVGVLLLFQLLLDLPERKVTLALLEALLGAMFLLWAVEERSRGHKEYSFAFLVVGLFLVSVAAYVLPR